MDIIVVGPGIDLSFPGKNVDDTGQHIVEADGLQHFLRDLLQRVGADDIGARVAGKLEDVGEIGVGGDGLHDLVGQLLLAERARSSS